MTFMHASENRTFRVILAALLILALALAAARPANALAGTLTLLVPGLIAALESWGISTQVDGLDGDAIATWFHDTFSDWAAAAGLVVTNVVNGIKMTPIGQIVLNPVASMVFKDFAVWLIQQNGLTAGGTPVQVVSGGTTLNGYQVWDSCTVVGSTYTYVYTCDSNCHLFVSLVNGSCYVFAVSLVSGARVHFQRYRNGSSSPINDSWVSLQNTYGNGYYHSSIVADYQSVNVPLVSYNYQDVLGGSGGVQAAEGTMDIVPTVSMSVPTTSDLQDKDYLLNTGLDVGADAVAWYDSVMGKVAANDFTATGTITNAGTITADQVLDQGAIREEDGVVVWPDVVQPIGVTGLDDIFPFCIPFDIYHFCQALAAEPVAPSFDVPFVIPGIVDYTFHLDLEDFDQVAALLRTLELLLFCVGLAFVTRSMFIRG